MKTTSAKLATQPLAKELKRALSTVQETPILASQNFNQVPLLKIEDDSMPDQRTIAQWHEWAKRGYATYSAILQRYSSEAEFKKVAGYQLYVELVMNLGFPKEHILFCSNHKQYLASIKMAFQEAKISLPKPVPSKYEGDLDFIQQWIRERRNNRYVTLRRGIIEGCQMLLDQLSQNSNAVHFHRYFQKCH